MASKPTTRPARKPVRVIGVTTEASPIASTAIDDAVVDDMSADDSARQNTTVDDADADKTAAASMPAKMEARRKTIAAAIVCAGGGRAKPKFPAPPAAAGKPVVAENGLGKKVSAGSRMPLFKRVTKVIERELDLIEKIVGRIGVDESVRTEAEHRARTLALLVRTLTELKKTQAGDEHRSDQDDDRPRDLDELRRRLSERLAKKLGSRAAVPAGGDVTRRTELPE